MYKEIIIILVVIAMVIGVDVISNNYTKSSFDIITSKLNVLKEYILKEDKDKATLKMQEIKEEWEKRYKLLAFYIEHDELEKVETEMVKMEADIEVEEFKHCISEVETTIFILGHIQEKEKFQLESIF